MGDEEQVEESRRRTESSHTEHEAERSAPLVCWAVVSAHGLQAWYHHCQAQAVERA